MLKGSSSTSIGTVVPDVVHLQGRPVLNRTADAVVAQVTLLHAVLQRAEIAVGVLQGAVDGRTGEAEPKPVPELEAHGERVALAAAPARAGLRAMALVHEAHDVVAAQRVKVVHLLERLQGRHQRAAPVSPQPPFEVLDAQRFLDVGIVAGFEVVRELGLEIAPVDDDEAPSDCRAPGAGASSGPRTPS